MPQKLITCEHCEGARICKADSGKSCDICRTAAGAPRKGPPKNVRCSVCMGHGRVWVEVEETPEGEPEAAEENEAPEDEDASE